ncbi:biotin/lipoate--protein ligase family protein [Falsiroseomonas oryziterrae]|uniref:biotin/lipoate--protein ligase family protein n=1 Tax=Falsiroseomonas oryziterrae TaxID=2911368 RepID=UPI001F45B02E|nr:biotin/lipoate--protein ligase family protein [Roseomonas sp. NPKOSM-4]
MSAVLPELPSVFTPVVPLREAGDAMERAVALAPQHGAGTLAWVRSASRIEAAVVLEPEMPLAAARAALYAAASALGDALAAFGPPEVPLTFRWPDRVAVNGGEIGRLRLAWAEGPEDAVPDWIVVGMEARLMFPQGWEPGHGIAQTALQEEGWEPEDCDPAELTAAWARHLMAGLAEWQRTDPTGGFKRLAERYLARLEQDERTEGGKRGLDPATGDLVVDRDGARTRFALIEALAG